ncbi:hypothetical protein DFH29DRAFT_784184, partial [Suillus ampliporus]
MIACCRSKCWVIHLKEENQNLHLPHSQRGVKGHVIVYPQEASAVANVLPPSMDEIMTPICVLFVGSSPPSAEWLRTKARPLIVQRERVRDALMWLSKHNPLYHDVCIDHELLNTLEDEQMLPMHVQHVKLNYGEDMLTSRYDAVSEVVDVQSSNVDFQNVVVADVYVHALANELSAAALRHVKNNGGGYIQIPHGPQPVNEFHNPSMFLMMYPTLYPYGLGGFEDDSRSVRMSMKRHVRHL